MLIIMYENGTITNISIIVELTVLQVIKIKKSKTIKLYYFAD